jgi:hypothetical protein
MKTIKNKLILAILICSAGLYISSCKKKDTTPPPANGTIGFHLHTNVDINEVDSLGAVYAMTGGRKISVSFAQLYISGIQLVKPDGSTYLVPGIIILKKQQIEPSIVGSVPSGNYTSVRFNVGLSAATNAATPAVSDSTLNIPAMWFSSPFQPSDFVFVNFQGKIDTTAAANAAVAQMAPFTYKIGTNANLKTVNMPAQNFTVSPNQIEYVHMVIDYNKLFTGIKLSTSSNLSINTPADNALPLAAQIANNIPLLFKYE